MRGYCDKAEYIFVNTDMFVEAVTVQSTTRIAQSEWQLGYRLLN